GRSDLFERNGGQPTVNALVDALYDGIEGDAELRALFPRDLAHGRSMQKLFFAEWLGGPRRDGERAYAGMRQRHDGRPLTPGLAASWLWHFRRAMDATVAAENDRTTIFAQVRSLAMVLVNRQVVPAGRDGRPCVHGGKGVRGSWPDSPPPVAWCGAGARIV